MMKVMLFAMALVAAYGAPIDNQDAPQQFSDNLKEAPKAQIETLVKDVLATKNDISSQLAESKNNIVEAARSITSSDDKLDRSVVGNGGKALKSAVGNSVRSLTNTAVADVKALVTNQKSSLENTKNALKSLEGRYLTSDGQDLVKMVIGAAES